MNLEIGTKVKQVGSDALWTITATFPRGTVGATLDVRSGKRDEVYYRKISMAQRSKWTLA
jgi:hypothetical protein